MSKTGSVANNAIADIRARRPRPRSLSDTLSAFAVACAVLSGNSFNTAAQLDTAAILLAFTTLTRAAWSLAGAGGLITVRRQR